MIKIDKTDNLYKYLENLGVQDIDKLYEELAKNGRYKRSDIHTYFISKFQPSMTNECDETDLEKILDYHIDLKKIKKISNKELNNLLKQYEENRDKNIREKIINSKLIEVLYLCINYHTLHKDIDIQDLVQVANMGLIEALEHYKASAKISFNDYILYWIREKIIEEFEEKENGKH